MPEENKAPPALSLAALFLGFSKIGLSGFGGVLPFARHYLVETSRWLSADEFNALLGLCQFLPGPNVVNLAVVVGKRERGLMGAIVAPLGLVTGPVIVALLLVMLYDRYGTLPEAQGMMRGVAAAGVGLLFAMGYRMASAVKDKLVFLPFAVLVFVAVALWRWSLPLVMLGALMLSGGLAYWRLQRQEAS
ncbi:MAG: chromate transporter [Rhodocyclaceae bacterium]